MAEIVSVKRAGEVVFDKRGDFICDHEKKYSNCKYCNVSAFCEHGKRLDKCRDCVGPSFCEHSRLKSHCKECKGSQICEHDKYKSVCKECKGSQICEHDRVKSHCKECKGSQICEHSRVKSHCKECKGSQICEHSRVKSHCKECKGSQICIHDKQKGACKECGGSKLCKSTWCTSTKRKKFNDHCLRCFIHLYPDVKISRNYKTKETDVVSRIIEYFPNFTWVADKKVSDGCSRRRPDLLLDLGSHIIIIEVDENHHTDYDCSCEHKRLMQLSQDVGHRSIVFIRFNPDEYVKNGKKITSCWRMNNSTGLLHVPVSKTEEWSKRIEILKETINYWVSNPTEKTIEIIELFY
jgi:hypothetical protein